MQKNLISRASTGAVCALAAGLFIAATCATHAQIPVEDLQAANYNPTTGVWTATIGSNATSSGTGNPTLVTNDTPNGSSAVSFNGNQQLTLGTSIPAGPYTVFVFLKPSSALTGTSGGGAVVSGSTGSLEYSVNNALHQRALSEFTLQLGLGTAVLPTTGFSNINVSVSGTGGTFRYNGTADGTTSGVTFTAPITTIGSQGNATGERFIGDIAEIQIYSSALTDLQRAAVETTFTAEYVNAVPEPGAYAMVLSALALLAGFQHLRSRRC